MSRGCRTPAVPVEPHLVRYAAGMASVGEQHDPARALELRGDNVTQIVHGHRLKFGDVQRRDDFVALITAPFFVLFAASAMLSLVALPLVVANTREGLRAIPKHVREASYAVGKTKIATTRRILLPASRPQLATGAMLGLGRIIGDTAIILVLLGATQNGGVPTELFTGGEARWLQVKFYAPSEVDLPRVLLVSVPYALKAGDADTLGAGPRRLTYWLACQPRCSHPK